jgi:phosphoglycerate kinase
LKKVAEHLSNLLSEEIYFHNDLNLDYFSENQKKISMLENVRFFEGETDNNELFSKKLAQLADVFVMDAFGSAHRSHCSTEGVSHFIDSCVGRLVEEELNSLEGILNNPSKPMLGIIGGSKISTKINIGFSLEEG